MDVRLKPPKPVTIYSGISIRIITSVIFLGGMIAVGISLYIKTRRESQEILDLASDKSEQTDLDK